MKLSNSLLILALFLTTTVTIGWFVVLLPYSRFQTLFNQVPIFVNQSFVSAYPQDLKITIKNGKVSTNRQNPFCLIFDQNSRTGVVFDNRPNLPIQNYQVTYQDICQPFALVGDDYFVYKDEHGTINIQKIDTSINYELNRSEVQKLVDNILPSLINFSRNAYYVLPLFAIPSLLIFFLLNNCWYAFITKSIGKWFGNNLDFTTAYSASLLVYTGLIFINIVILNYLVNYLLKFSLILSFPFFNTIVISYIANILLKPKNNSSITKTPSPVS